MHLPQTPVLAVVFDLDGVLMDFVPSARAEHLAARTGLSPQLIAALFSSDFETRAEAGAFATGAEYLLAFNRALGCDLTREEWIAARKAAMRPRPAMVELVRGLAPRVTIGALTNNGALLREALPELTGPFWPLLQPRLWVSCEFGARKPDPQLYLRLATRLALSPAEILFVDDSAANCEGARAAGLQAIHFQDETQAVAVIHAAAVG